MAAIDHATTTAAVVGALLLTGLLAALAQTEPNAPVDDLPRQTGSAFGDASSPDKNDTTSTVTPEARRTATDTPAADEFPEQPPPQPTPPPEEPGYGATDTPDSVQVRPILDVKTPTTCLVEGTCADPKEDCKRIKEGWE